ncbi:rod shape-determining protein RodA [Sphingomonas aestuarii]
MPWLMLFAVLAITAAGTATLYSVAGGEMSPWASRHALRFAVLFVAMLAISRMPVRVLREYAYLFFGGALSLLILVEAIGQVGMGAQRWIDLGPIRLQPSEFMKLASVLALARFYDTAPPKSISRAVVLAIPVTMIALPAGLVMLQPDLGTAIMILVAGFTIIFLGGTAMRWFAGAGLVLMAAMPLGWSRLHDYQRNRLLVFLDPESDPLGAGYHIAQSKIAIGSGGLFGKGFLQGTQSQLAYLPETHTDFILAAMMEEWGLVGGLTVLAAYAMLIAWVMRRAEAARTSFARLVCAGLAVTLFLYVAINMAMVMGLAPVVGIPLPLLSYGGSAMMTAMILLGIVMAIHREEKRAGEGGASLI